MENSQVGEAQSLIGRYGVKIWTSDKTVAPVNLQNDIPVTDLIPVQAIRVQAVGLHDCHAAFRVRGTTSLARGEIHAASPGHRHRVPR